MNKECEIISEDLRKARRELETYIDVTEEDLMKIYSLALRYAQERESLAVRIKREGGSGISWHLRQWL